MSLPETVNDKVKINGGKEARAGKGVRWSWVLNDREGLTVFYSFIRERQVARMSSRSWRLLL